MSITIKKVNTRMPEVFPSLWKRLAFPLVGLSVMIGILCYVLYFSVEKEDPQAIPLIQAEPGPYRVKPENPGGRSVPHQDKLVYERLSLQDQPEYEAQFISPVEDPIDVQQLGKEKGIGDLAQELAQSIPEEKVNPVLPSNAIPSSTGKGAGGQTIQPLVVKSINAPKKPTLSAALPVVSSNPVGQRVPTKLYRVQLASSRSADILIKEWKRLQQLYPDLLKNYQPTYLRLKEDKGIYYVLRTGNFSTLAMVKKFHQKLQQKKINCKIIETP